jgi:HEAT repeat protein
MTGIEVSLAQLAEADWAGRVGAAEALATYGGDDPRVVPALKAALSDPENTAITEAAMYALLAIGTADADRALLATLTEGDEETAEHLAWFLNQVGRHGQARAWDLLHLYGEQ